MVMSSSKRVVVVALAGNLLIAATKAGAAAWTGSSAMLSEAIHSFVDTGNQVLLLYGMRRAARRADPEHPIGYGREPLISGALSDHWVTTERFAAVKIHRRSWCCLKTARR